VLITSSSDEKIERAMALGAMSGINYHRTPEWDQEVLRLTDGHGADCIIEVGGSGTLSRSFGSLAVGGKVGLVGVLAGRTSDISAERLMFRRGNLHGIMVGERPLFEALNLAVERNGIKPVIDRVFMLDDARAAFAYQRTGSFMGKLVVVI
jgi:NADPH:quinone reductase-like Zn-dependent oxidoreductase